MADKKLNLNQPLLSVRRFSLPVASQKDEKRTTDNSIPIAPPHPSYKSELKSGPMRHPGSVPFLWEHSPGRPKGEGEPQTHANEQPPIAPKLPPGRISKPKRQDSEDPSVTKGLEEVPNGSQNIPSPDEISYKDKLDDGSSDSGDGDEAYLDALDTLSRSESVFFNCSVTGLSGLDGPDLKAAGTFSTDPQTRDFMMGRFLPAAKAMTSEAPQHAPRKQPVLWEKPKPKLVKKVVNGDKQPTLRYGPNIMLNNAHENAEDDSDDDYDDQGQFPAKVCGLLPRFCLKSSFCLLNPVPGISMKPRVPMSPASRTRGSSSSAGSCSEPENENTRAAIYEQTSVNRFRTEMHEDKSVLKNESTRVTYPCNPQNLEGSTLYRRLQGNGMSPYYNELAECHPLPGQKGFLNIPEEAMNGGVNGYCHRKAFSSFQELLADESNSGEIDHNSPTAEKTLYVDTVHKVVSARPNLVPNLRDNDFKILAKSKGKKETPTVNSYDQHIEHSVISDGEATIQPNSQTSVDLPSSAGKSDQRAGMDTLKGFEQDEDLYHDSTTSPTLKVPGDVNLDFEMQEPQKVTNEDYALGRKSKFPVAPPLPKSPSDSWLGRTLPSMSSRNASTRSRLGTGYSVRKVVSNAQLVDPKRQNIVKKTNSQHQNFQFSQVKLIHCLQFLSLSV
ncbi:hypothetical protein RJ639_043694 [Escallonia herrerae]|uniref:Uncharacterized protein n=1 Tax=Escallonia herrerae TaxID=1293975 RepID=A0AA89B977_9ASTE|nr:hypothetical protein RJ639_043694 [Escallonia herrerae]